MNRKSSLKRKGDFEYIDNDFRYKRSKNINKNDEKDNKKKDEKDNKKKDEKKNNNDKSNKYINKRKNKNLDYIFFDLFKNIGTGDCDDCNNDYNKNDDEGYLYTKNNDEDTNQRKGKKKRLVFISDEDLNTFLNGIKIEPKEINDLLTICNAYDNLINKYPDITYESVKLTEFKFKSINKIWKMRNELIEISEMIGLNSIKKQFISQIAYLLSEHKEEMLMHTIIYGDPGCGKTTIAKLIGRAYHKSGILKSNAFVCATRKQLIGKFLGHTAPQTTEMFDKAKGGVIFIDEIYSMGNHSESHNDSFSKEAIDTINQLLTERTDTMCIIAGYENDSERDFFGSNQGLQSRFPWKFVIDKYTPEEMYKMFNLYVNRGKWTIQEPDKFINGEFFKKNEQYFKFFGRDITSFLTKCYIQHSIRLFLEDTNKILTTEDLKNGFNEHKLNKGLKSEDKTYPYHSMYI